MANSQVQTPERPAPIPDADHSIAPHRHFRISVQRLVLGMFIAELDRPWIDTPFLLQGFAIDSSIELDTLRKYCRFVYVDLELSSPDVSDAIRSAEQLSAGDGKPEEKPDFRSLAEPAAAVVKPAARPRLPARAYRVRADLKVTTGTRDRFRDLIRSSHGVANEEPESETSWRKVLGALTGLFKRDPSAGRSESELKQARSAIQAELLTGLPAGTKLTRYTEQRPVVEELPRARRSLAQGEQILQRVVTDVKSGAIPQVEKVRDAVDEMVESMIDNPDALMWIARLRDEDANTYSHGVKVSLYMIALGRNLGFPKEQLANLGMIGMLADVGKMKLPRALLEKPGMLNPAEHSIVKEHVRLGLESLTQTAPLPPEVEQGIAQHHERLDGSGYPKGLRGDEIGIFGRIAGIADCFAALITSRPYANAQAPQDALMNLYQWAGTSFHEALVEQFVQSVGVFPVGSMVELSSGEIAVVVAQNRVRRLEPKVLLLTWPDKRPLGRPIERDLFTSGKDHLGKPLRIARGLPAGAYGLKLRDFYADTLVQANQLA